MKRLALLLFLFSADSAFGQTQRDSLFVPGGVRMYQLSLPKTIKELIDIHYEKNNDPVKGYLLDGTRIIIENYRKGQPLLIKVKNTDDTEETIRKSPCYIDPYSPES